MKMILLLLLMSSVSFAASSEDVLKSTSSRSDRQSCTSYRYCYGYKFGKGYGYRYGSCSGHKERTVKVKTYVSATTNKEFQETEYGSWGSCR